MRGYGPPWLPGRDQVAELDGERSPLRADGTWRVRARVLAIDGVGCTAEAGAQGREDAPLDEGYERHALGSPATATRVTPSIGV